MTSTIPTGISFYMPSGTRTEIVPSSIDQIDKFIRANKKEIENHFRRSALLSTCIAELIAMYDNPAAFSEALKTLEEIAAFHK
jgi:hypothetical protein